MPLCLLVCPRKGNPRALLGMQIDAATVENSLKLPQKLKMELPYDPALLLLGIYPWKPKTLIQKNICSIIYNSQDLEAA